MNNKAQAFLQAREQDSQQAQAMSVRLSTTEIVIANRWRTPSQSYRAIVAELMAIADEHLRELHDSSADMKTTAS